MKNFNRITAIQLPSGEIVKAFPFHVCLKGLENSILCRDDEDYDTIVKYIAICALRKNVAVVIYIVLSNHLHVTILTASQESADAYAEEIKRMASQWVSNKYKVFNLMKNVKASAILIDNDWHLLNTLAYVPRNALDNGSSISSYKWSGYRAMFKGKSIPNGCKKISEFSARQLKRIFHTNDNIKGQNWYLNEQMELEPFGFCYNAYLESAFNNDESLFLKRIGSLNPAEMKFKLVDSPRTRINDTELFKEADDISRRWFDTGLEAIPFEKKIRLLPYIYRIKLTSVSQLARVFSLEKTQVASILGIRYDKD